MKKALLPLAGALAVVLLSGCSGGPAAAVIPPASERPVVEPIQPTRAPSTPEPENPAESSDPGTTVDPNITDPTPLPTDCRAILTPEVLAQLEGVPLNHESYGAAVGTQVDGSLSCIWGEPEDESQMLYTRIAKYGNEAASAFVTDARGTGLECTEFEGATRCSGEQTAEGMQTAVGRTLYVRGGVVIDTQFTDLAPDGYTNAIIQSIWPEASD